MAGPRRLAEFTDRAEELARLEELRSAPPVRVHAALVGLRRSGKSVLLEEFAARHLTDAIVALVDADDAANALPTWSLHVVAALVGGATDPPIDIAPRPADIRRAAATLELGVRQEIEDLLALLDAKRQDNYQLFTGPLRLAETIATTRGREVILAIDEFPEVLAFKKVRGLNKLEGALRAIVERNAPHVFFVITGSAVRQMKALLSGDSPLLTRFEQIVLRPFTPEDAEVLLDRLLKTGSRAIEPHARAIVLNWVRGHPFYLARLIRRAAALSEHEITQEHLHDAFQLEVIEPKGLIAQACQWIYDNSLGEKGNDGRQLLLELARLDNAAKPADLNTALGWDRSKLSKQVAALIEADLIAEQGEGEGAYAALTDPLFAVWLAVKAGRLGTLQADTVAALRKTVAQLRDQAGTWYEAYHQLALAHFDGKSWPAELFGVTGRREIVVPAFAFDSIEPNPTMFDSEGIVHGKPSQIEADAYALDSEGWLTEVKAERGQATKGDIAKLERCAQVFSQKGGRKIDRLWFIAQTTFTPEAVTFARQKGIYMTRGSQLREIRRLQAERAATRRRAAARAAKKAARTTSTP